MAVRPLVNIERLTTAHVNSVDGSMTYESGISYKANTTVSYNGSLYTANVDIEDTDTDTPDIAPDKWSLTINASESGTSGDISALAARVSALEDTVGDEDSGLVKDVDDIFSDLTAAGYGLVKVDRLTATADGVKTYQAIMEELATSVGAYARSLSDDECIMITSAQIGGMGRVNTINDVYINTIGNLSIQGLSQSLTATETHINSFYMVNTANNSHLNRTVINSGGVTFSNKDSDAPASGSSNEIRYALFKKIIPTS